MSNVLSIGVLGGGMWGANLIRTCARLGVLGGVCDPDAAALERVRATYPNARTENDPARFIQDSSYDALIIAAPAPLHARLAMEAMRAGKHVFIEKPLALTEEDGLAIAATAEATGKTAFVGHLLLYHPAVRHMMRLIEEGAIGDIRHVRSRRLSLGRVRKHENVWWSFAPHDVSVCLALFNAEPLNATAFTSAFLNPEIADLAYTEFTFPGNRSAHIEVSWLDPDKGWRLDVFGTRGVFTLTDSRSGSKLTLTPCQAQPSDGAFTFTREDAVDITLPGGEPLEAEVQAFIDAVAKGAPYPTDAHHGTAVLRALALADRAVSSTSKESFQSV